MLLKYLASYSTKEITPWKGQHHQPFSFKPNPDHYLPLNLTLNFVLILIPELPELSLHIATKKIVYHNR